MRRGDVTTGVCDAARSTSGVTLTAALPKGCFGSGVRASPAVSASTRTALQFCGVMSAFGDGTVTKYDLRGEFVLWPVKIDFGVTQILG